MTWAKQEKGLQGLEGFGVGALPQTVATAGFCGRRGGRQHYECQMAVAFAQGLMILTK